MKVMPMTPGEKVAYDARHYRVKRLRGSASLQVCVRCAELGVGRQAREWAQVHGTDGEDPWADYVPMCSGCHTAYDGRGHHTPHTEDSKRKMSESHKAAFAAGRLPTRANSAKTHCRKKHPYDDVNTYRRPDGGRDCKICMRDRTRRSRQGGKGGEL